MKSNNLFTFVKKFVVATQGKRDHRAINGSDRINDDLENGSDSGGSSVAVERYLYLLCIVF